jgi:hypothetical protein
MLKIVIYGGGVGLYDVITRINENQANLVAVLDRNAPEKRSLYIPENVLYLAPEKVTELDFDYIVISSANYLTEIYEYLVNKGVDKDKIIAADIAVKLDKPYQNEEVLRKIFLPDSIKKGYLIYDIFGKKNISDVENKIGPGLDYVRVATLDLLASQVINNKIDGAIAELGVFQGKFSALLSEIFPERDLWLFDTFEGFDEKDLDDKTVDMESIHFTLMDKELKDTTVELALSNIPHREKCIVRKGYFPDTTEGISDDVKFAFVSLDTDLYNPIYEGLKWFYPRMTHGGFIMIHDYNASRVGFIPGVKRAIDQFCAENGTVAVPIADAYGSAIIAKV